MRRALMIVLLSSVVAALGWPSTANANLLSASATNCGTPFYENPFVRWGDHNHYFLVSKGHFEWDAAPSGWNLNGGARTVTDRTSLDLREGGEGDERVIVVPAGANVVTPTSCVGLTDPTMRFEAKSLKGTGTLVVSVLFWGPLGIPLELPVGSISGAQRSWKPSSQTLIVANLLTLLGRDKTPVAFRFKTYGPLFGPGAAFAVDDVFVDPYRKG